MKKERRGKIKETREMKKLNIYFRFASSFGYHSHGHAWREAGLAKPNTTPGNRRLWACSAFPAVCQLM